jgi:hypothetical protein
VLAYLANASLAAKFAIFVTFFERAAPANGLGEAALGAVLGVGDAAHRGEQGQAIFLGQGQEQLAVVSDGLEQGSGAANFFK